MTLNFKLQTKKNLLAFSGGVDSTALFFLLLNQNIPFDIAIVDYNIREQSKDEVDYAKKLALQYNKKCFVRSVLSTTINFEASARTVRYNFFEELIYKYNYETLLTAHQLNDRFEWFLMQFSKGAGLCELLGLNEFEYRANYILYRPLLNISKESLETFLKNENIKYFYDDTNSDITYKRNYFREEFCNSFLKKFQNGVENSFSYLKKDLLSLNIQEEPFYKNMELEIFKNGNDDNINIRIIDKSLKKRGYIMSKAQRDEILRQENCVIDKYAICLTSNFIYIAPYKKNITMTKNFKENCRVLKVPSKIRYYLYESKISLDNISI